MTRRIDIEREEQEAQAAYDRWLQRAQATPSRGGNVYEQHAVINRFWESYLALSQDLRKKGWRPTQEGGWQQKPTRSA